MPSDWHFLNRHTFCEIHRESLVWFFYCNKITSKLLFIKGKTYCFLVCKLKIDVSLGFN